MGALGHEREEGLGSTIKTLPSFTSLCCVVMLSARTVHLAFARCTTVYSYGRLAVGCCMAIGIQLLHLLLQAQQQRLYCASIKI